MTPAQALQQQLAAGGKSLEEERRRSGELREAVEKLRATLEQVERESKTALEEQAHQHEAAVQVCGGCMGCLCSALNGASQCACIGA